MPHKYLAPVTAGRLYALDWLRVIGILLLIITHAGSLFDPYPQVGIKGKPNTGLILLVAFLHQWRLGLLFLVAGAGSYMALRSSSLPLYIYRRAARLLIPLALGTFLIIPIERYIWSSYDRGFITFYGRLWYFTLTGTRSFSWGYLWFLAYLFLFTITVLPVLGKATRMISRTAVLVRGDSWCRTVLLWMPIVLCEVMLRSRYPIETYNLLTDINSICRYGWYYACGYIIASSDELKRKLRRDANYTLIVGASASAVLLALVYLRKKPTAGMSWEWLAYTVLLGINQVAWVNAVIGYGLSYLDKWNSQLPYYRDACYPIYLLHQPILQFTAKRVTKWSMSAGLQCVVIIMCTLIVAALIYETAVRRYAPMRFMFGLARQKKAGASVVEN